MSRWLSFGAIKKDVLATSSLFLLLTILKRVFLCCSFFMELLDARLCSVLRMPRLI